MARNKTEQQRPAKQQLAQQRPQQQRTLHERKIRLCIHAAIFVVVNAGLITMNLMRRPEQLWFYWPLCGWGLGLALHAWIVYQHRAKTH